MSTTSVALLVGMAVLIWGARTLHYRMQFGRWFWGRLPEPERRRLLPNDSRFAYQRGWNEGREALRRELAERDQRGAT